MKRTGAVLISGLFLLLGCADHSTEPDSEAAMNVIFLHHSTGRSIWEGGVQNWIAEYNTENNTEYVITEINFPKASPYGWKNYPYDYWNIWVNHAGDEPYVRESTSDRGLVTRLKSLAKAVRSGDIFKSSGEPTLEILTKDYDMVVWKHCFPVTNIKQNTGIPDVTSEEKRMENYIVQYEALKQKMHEFPETKFLVWTGAAQVESKATEEEAERARQFADWVKNEWNETGDNIFVWDFHELETEGGLYLKPEYARGQNDSHPSDEFAQRVAPLFGQRIVDILEDRGDATPITGKRTAVAETE